MRIDSLRLVNFRNYAQQEVCFSDGVNLVCGENAQGKTNLLEAVFLLTGSRSWRAARKSELVSFGQQQAMVSADVFSRSREFALRLGFSCGGRSSAQVNGVRLKSPGLLSETLRCVLFSPEDLQLLRGAPEKRRRFLDTALCQLRPRYAQCLAQYQKVLEGKTSILRKSAERPDMLALLPEFDERLVTLGACLMEYRARFCALLAPVCSDIYSDIASGREHLTVRYQTVSSVSDPGADRKTLERELSEHLASHRQAEMRLLQCLSGVHKDDLVLEIDGRACRAFASQGQTRSAALALKFAERELFFRDGGEYPVLLLDDVLSELDARRQAYVVGHMPGGQAIITCCEDTGRFSGCRCIAVAGGRIL